MTRVIVTFDDGFKLPMEGPNVDKTLKGPNPEKVFKDKAKEAYPKKNPASWGVEGETPTPFTKSDKKTDKPTTPTVKPAPAEVKPAPAEVKPAPAEVTPAPPDSTINDIVAQKEKTEADAKKAAAEAEARARETKDAKDRQAALDAQREYRIAQEKADRARREAESKPVQTVTPAPNNYPNDDVINNAAKKQGDNKPAGTPATTTPVSPPAPITGTKLPPLTPADNKPAEPADNKPAEPADNKPAEPAGPSLWDRIKAGASEVGQAISGALTPSSTPAQSPAQSSSTAPVQQGTPSKEEIEAKLKELENSPNEAVRQEAKKQRDRLNGKPGGEVGGSNSGAKVQPTGPNPGGGGNSEVDKTSGTATVGTGTGQGTNPVKTGPGKSFDNPLGTQPAAGASQQGAPGAGPAAGTDQALPSDVDNDKIRRDRRLQDAEIARLKQLVGNKSTESGGWRDAGSGTRVWRGGPGTDPKWTGYVFTDGDIMPAAADSTGVDPARKDASGKPVSPYVGGKGSDKYDSQRTQELLLGKERAAQQIDQLKKQLKEDFNRILKLSGFNR